jgi:hypothetical protein
MSQRQALLAPHEIRVFARTSPRYAACTRPLHVDNRRRNRSLTLSNQKQLVHVSAQQPAAMNRPISRAKLAALPWVAAGALFGCTVDPTPSEADVDAMSDSPASGETLGTATQAFIDTDSVKVTGDKVDFGGSLWGINSPVGSGTMTWSVVNGFYTPRLTGTLHMHDAAGKSARMHISYWDGGGGFISTRHGGIVQASGNGHQSWSVDLSPTTLFQIVEAHVCTELSDNGVDFPQVACETYIMD